MPQNTPPAPGDNTILPSFQKRPDGAPRFTLSLPPGFESDPGLEILARTETKHTGFECTTRLFLDAHLRPGDIFIDVGAHLGVYSLGAATLYPGEIKVFAFEPHPLNVLTLVRQLALNEQQHNIEVVCSAVGAEAGFGKLWPFSTMGNFISAERPDGAPDDNPPLTVPVMPLDSLLTDRPELSSARILMKIDVEGYEPNVIAGAEKLLASGHVAALILEKSDFYAQPDRWRDFETMVERLRAHGYTLHWFPHAHLPCALIPWVPGNETGNIVAIGPGMELQPVYDAPYSPYTALPPPMRENFSEADQAALTEQLIEAKATDGWRWVDPRNLFDGAEDRASLALPHVPPKGRVLDLGAGLMSMAMKLKIGATYTPVDLVRYAKSTVLADLNGGQFPDGAWDCGLTLELLEHIHDVPGLLEKIRSVSDRLVGTYRCIEESGDIRERRTHGYFNDFDRDTLKALLAAAGWQTVSLEPHGAHTLFVCDKK